MAPFTNVDEYYSNIDKTKADTLRSVVDYILTLDPRMDVKIAWNQPQLHIGKTYIFGMSAATHHLMLAPWGDGILDAHRSQLGDYFVNKRTFRIPVDWQLDRDLIRSLVEARMTQVGL